MHKQIFIGKNKQFIIDWISQLPLDSDKKYVVEIKRHRESRTNEANRYLWVLIDKLAEQSDSGLGKTEIYKREIKEMGGVSHTILVQDKDKNDVTKMWESKGLGWSVDFYPSQVKNCSNAILYHGSSLFDSKTMSRLLDRIIQECQAVGIETITPDEKAKMIAQMESYNG